MVKFFCEDDNQKPLIQIQVISQHPVENCALIILDPQKYFINLHTEAYPQKIAQLLRTNIFPLYKISQFVNLEGSIFEKNLNWTKMQNSPETDFVDEIKNFADGQTIIKNGYSVFNPEFENFLEANNISTLYFAGFDTDVCVLINSALAFDKGYRVFVLTNYCASHSGKSEHLAALMVLRRIIGQQGLLDAYFE